VTGIGRNRRRTGAGTIWRAAQSPGRA
jgi:hypothetical protein